jgi:hypothetical protein
MLIVNNCRDFNGKDNGKSYCHGHNTRNCSWGDRNLKLSFTEQPVAVFAILKKKKESGKCSKKNER